MIDAVYIGLWAWLFCGPLSEGGEVFGGLRRMLSRLPEWAFKPLIGCPKCHAGQLAFWWQAYEATHGRSFDFRFIIVAIMTAILSTAVADIVETWKNK